MEYRTLNIEDLSDLAKVHIECFKGTFIASFGPYLVEKYYEEYYAENPLFVMAEENGEMVGFCMGYKTGAKARDNFMRKYRVRLALRMLWLCLCLNKLAIHKCWGMLKRRKVETKKKKEVDADLLSICVKDQYKGKGVAGRLVEEFEKLLLDKGLKDYTLSVYKTNERAITFYKRMGLKVISESDDEYKMFKLIKAKG